MIRIILVLLISQNLFADQCRKHSECAVGCKVENVAGCFYKSEIKFKPFQENKCDLPIGGLTCVCKKHKCEFTNPAELKIETD